MYVVRVAVLDGGDNVRFDPCSAVAGVIMQKLMPRLLQILLLLLSITAARHARAADLGPWPSVSGMPWRSGVGNSFRPFEEWRGRPLDVCVVWHPHRSWEELRKANGEVVERLAGMKCRLSMGIAMLPKTHSGQFAECAAGKFDDSYRAVAERLVGWGHGNAILRIGWEANGPRSGDGDGGGFPWGIEGDVEPYIACFRRIVGVMRGVSQKFVVEWAMKKATENMGGRPISDAWPGDDWVDLVGIDYYDGYPAYRDAGAWSRDYAAKADGGPRGLGAWLTFAKSRGKQLAVPEWGVRNRRGAGDDNALFVDRMVAFFQENAADIAYEAYFNPYSGANARIFSVYPEGNNPKAAAKYLEAYRPK